MAALSRLVSARLERPAMRRDEMFAGVCWMLLALETDPACLCAAVWSGLSTEKSSSM